MNKVKEINLEYGQPTVAAAIQNMVNQLSTSKGQGYKAVILIHGYGSSGVGGSIKIAVRKRLQEPSLSGIVRGYCAGEDWHERKKEMTALCKDLSNYSGRIAGNRGITVVLIK